MMSDTAIRVRRRAYPAKGKAITGLRLAKKLDAEQFCSKARIAAKTLARLENGEKAFVSTLTRVATALGVGLAEIVDGLPQPDAAPELVSPRLCVITLTLNIKIDNFDELQGPLELLSQLKKFGLSGEFDVNGVSEGSTKVEFIGTEGDWSILDGAFRAGSLADLGVERLTREPPTPSVLAPATLAELGEGELRWPWRRWRQRRLFRRVFEAQSTAFQSADSAPWNRPGYWSRYRKSMVLSLMALVCSFSGILPLDARFGYGLGILLALAASLLGRWTRLAKMRQRERLMFLGMSDPGDVRLRSTGEVLPGIITRINRGFRWPGYRLPLIALLLNIIAALVWPRCIGFEKTPEGYRFGVVNRASPPPPQPPEE